MKTMFTITQTANMAQLMSSPTINTTLDRFTSRFNDFRDWCIIQLDVRTWEMSELDTIVGKDSVSFSHSFTFNNQEDATAFKLVFDL